jgi:hypothetical protein
MDINVKNAANYFFPNPSLETVYFEAIANSIDAEATQIWIKINIDDFSNVSSFDLEISDNGNGFTDKNFQKFSSLLEVDKKTHKGIGRLVYLQYFDEIEVESFFNNQSRQFTFNENFNGKSKSVDTKNKDNRTTFYFSGKKIIANIKDTVN